MFQWATEGRRTTAREQASSDTELKQPFLNRTRERVARANLTTVYVAEFTAMREKVMYVDAAIHAALN